MGHSLEVQDMLSHVPAELCESIKQYATDTVLLKSRYLFVHRVKGQQVGFCTHCRKEQSMEVAKKHGEEVVCSHCSSECIVKSHGRGRKYLYDAGYFVYFSKSIKDPNVITARGVYVQRDYSGDYVEVETEYLLSAIYVFGNGESRMMNRSYWWKSDYWEMKEKVFAESHSVMSSKSCFLSEESVAEAVAGTPFQYSTWEAFAKRSHLILFFDVAAKYPCVEYLSKLGLGDFVREKMNGYRTFGAINWRGDTLPSVLKVSKQDIKDIRSADRFSMLTLRLLQLAKKDGVKFKVEDAKKLSCLIGGESGFNDFQKIRKFTKLNVIRNYLEKQVAKRYRTGELVLVAWRDYLADCIQLGMDVRDESILLPTNLYRAHQATIEKIKHKADEALSEQIRLHVLRLKTLEFEKGNLFIRPARDSAELIAEGNALKHCVGGYAARYARGETILLVIRKKDEPDKPFFTLESRGGRIVQVYGFRNCAPPKEVKAFVDAFEATKLKKETRKGVAV